MKKGSSLNQLSTETVIFEDVLRSISITKAISQAFFFEQVFLHPSEPTNKMGKDPKAVVCWENWKSIPVAEQDNEG